MADVYTHLRELGVAFFFYCKKDLKEVKPTYFYDICINHINIPIKLTISMIAKENTNFSDREMQTIKNAFKLGQAIKENLKIPDNPKITWVGCDTQSDSPIDLIIDNYKFSLKEESFILENMGLYKLLNILLNTHKFNSGMHVFKEFANNEFENWFNVTCNCLLKDGPTTFKKVRTNKYDVIGELSGNSMVLNYNSSDIIKFDDIRHLEYEEFAKRTNSHLREYVFSKWIKEAVENDETYIQSKKHCAITAGENLLKLVKPCEKTSPLSLLRFFRIIDEEYYYAKTTNSTLAIYRVPAAAEASKHIIINNIFFDVPKSQLNFYTEILNTKNNNKIVFRNELRYSHGQFNGTPEAKCYIDRKFQDLSIMYEKLV